MIILASQSPRRREILSRLTEQFLVCPSDADEHIPAAAPRDYVLALANKKAASVASRYPRDVVVAADTIVVLDDAILGKPADEREARAFLRALSSRAHTVYTGVAVVKDGQTRAFVEGTEVRFRALTEELIDFYVKTGEPMDKAGAYGIQGVGGRFVEGITGDFFNVMGLPLCALSRVLEEMNVLDGEAE